MSETVTQGIGSMQINLASSLTVALVFATSLTAIAGDKPTKPDEAQLRAWIAALANPGPKRNFRTPGDRLTNDDRENLKPVCAAYENLTKHFVAALPYLMESLDDERFSYPQEHPSSGVFSNRSVGDACHNIIERKVLLRNPAVIDGRDIAVWHRMPINKQWYVRAKGMTLFEMQVDALDWILKQPAPSFGVSRETWDERLKELRQFRAEFVANGKAIDKVLGPPIEGK